jgi:hypothetical protein
MLSKVLQSETWRLSAGVHHCFKRRSTRGKETCYEIMMLMMMMIMTIIIQRNKIIHECLSMSSAALTYGIIIWKPVYKRLWLLCVRIFDRLLWFSSVSYLRIRKSVKGKWRYKTFQDHALRCCYYWTLGTKRKGAWMAFSSINRSIGQKPERENTHTHTHTHNVVISWN